MENLFLKILNMSLTGALVILVVLLARLLLRRAPKVFSYALWAVVLLRLLCPFTIESAFSLAPSVQVRPGEWNDDLVAVDVSQREVTIAVGGAPVSRPEPPAPHTPAAPAVPAPSQPAAPAAAAPATPGPWSIAGAVWLAGAVLLLGYSLVSLLRLRRKLVGYVPLEGEKNVRLADHIPSPFVLGLLRPKIYLPSGLPENERDYILLHERTHIRRGDHIFRALAWLALAAHWFNPLVWLAFHLAGKDMEMSCDEAVLRKMGRDIRADYSSSLLRLSVGGKLPAGPLAFGSGDPQSRIKNVLSYKKPALWVMVVALIAVVCAGVALATDPSSFSGPGKPADFVFHEPGPAELWVDMTDYPPDEPWPESMELQMPEYPGVTFRWTREMVTAVIEDGESPLPEGLSVTEDGQGILFFGETIWSVYLCDLNGDGLRDMCFTADFSERRGDQRVLGCYYGYNTFSSGYMDSAYAHFLRLEGDQLWVEERDYESGAVIRSGPLALTESGLDILYPSGGIRIPDADLTLSLDTTGEEPCVRMEGTVGGVELPRGAFWSPPHLFEEYPCGWLSMVYPGFTDGIEGHVIAGWTDESRTSVLLSTKMTAMLSSLGNVGWWDFTVDLASGTVTEMTAQPIQQSTLPGETRYYPESISDGEAVKAARIAAKLLTAGEDYYNNYTAELPALYTALLGGAPFYSVDAEKTLTFDTIAEDLDPYGIGYEITRYASVDFDGDGLQELILYVEQQGAFYFILHEMDGALYSYGAALKEMQNIKTDGTFWDRYVYPPEGDGQGVGYARVSFTNTGLEFHPFTYDISLPSNENGLDDDYRLVVDGQPADSQTFEAAVAAQEAKPDVVWYEFPKQAPAPTQPIAPVDLPSLDGLFFSDGWHDSVNVEGVDVQEMYWYSPVQYYPQGQLFFTNPAFLGPAFEGRTVYGHAAWTDDRHTIVQIGWSFDELPFLYFDVDLSSGEVMCSAVWDGLTDEDLFAVAQTFSLLMEQAEVYKTSGAYRPMEDGPLPFDRPIELEFASGAGAWQTNLLLHPDGSFVGDFEDADMTTQYVCPFHGRFRDITQVTDTSWSLTLDELVLDTKYPIGREWDEGVIHYISSAPYGFSKRDSEGDSIPLEPGAQFMLYTPDASGYRPTDELYGFNSANTDHDSVMYRFWTWMPSGSKIGAWGWDTILGCYGLCNMETGYGFFSR